MARPRPKVVFLGALPPPYMGPTLATEVILGSRLRERFELIHLDTSDHRDIDTLGALDFMNIYLALKAYVDLIGLLVRHWPDIVYIPISQTTVGYLKDSGFVLISKLFGRKVICHLRGGNFGNWFASASPLTRWYVRKVHGMVDGQIVLGQNLKRIFAGILPESKLHVVPNGKDIAYGDKPPRGQRVRLLYLANMIPTKGAMDVLQAVEQVTRRCPDVEFVFCGGWSDPGFRTSIEAFLEAHPHLPIRWLGKLHGTAKSDVINSSDIFLFPTYYPPEGHPWVVVEAMAAGLPIISTDQGAIVESVIDGRNGFIVAKQNPAELAEKTIRLIEDTQLRERMGTESRRLYEEAFTEERMVERLAFALNAVIAA